MLCSRHEKEFPHFSGHWDLVRCALTADSGTTDHILFIHTSVSFVENAEAKALTQNPGACELVKHLESQDMSPKVPFRWCGLTHLHVYQVGDVTTAAVPHFELSDSRLLEHK